MHTLNLDSKKLTGFSKNSFLTFKKKSGLNLKNKKLFLVSKQKDAVSTFYKNSVKSITVKENIDFLKRIRCYRGVRHFNRLPCRGQRTRTNSRTSRILNK
jgi:small subunit ribosomal protein S13